MVQNDDGDSGNDEPSEEAGAGPAPVARSNSDLEPGRAPLNIPEEEPSPDEEMEPDAAEAQRDVDVEEEPAEMVFRELVGVPEQLPDVLLDRPPLPPRSPSPPSGRLANRLAMLTNPRPAYECGQLTEELLVKIPPESRLKYINSVFLRNE